MASDDAMARTFRRILKILGAIVAGIVGLAALTVIALIFIDWNLFRPFLTEQASSASGREVSIGDFEVDLSSRPELRVRNLVIGNPDWAKHKAMMRVGAADMVIRLWPLLVGRLEIDRLRVSGAAFHLEKAKGKDNWHFGTTGATTGAVKAVSPKRRTEFPVIKRLEIQDSDITFTSDALKQPVAAHFDMVTARTDGRDAPVRLDMKGRYKRKPFSAEFAFGSFNTLRMGGKPFPTKGTLDVGSIKGTLDGTVSEPLQFKGWQGQVSISGSNMDELHDLLGLPVPTSPPYKLAGKISKEDETWHLKDFQGRLGSTDLAGDIAVDTGKTPARLVAKVTSNAVDMSDLKGFIGRSPETKPPAKGGNPAERAQPGRARFLIPEETFHLDKLRGMNVALNFDGKSIKSGGRALDNLKVTLQLDSGKLIIDSLSLGTLDGTISGSATLDASHDMPNVAARLQLKGIRLGTLLKVSGITDASHGTFRGYLALRAHGTSMHQLAAHMDGSGVLVMEGGEISDLMLQLAALDLQQALREVLRPKTKMIPIQCFIAPIQVNDGVMTANPWVFSTTDTLLNLTGKVNLATEKLDMRLLAQPKDYSFFNALTAIDIEGDLTHRTASVNKLGVAVKLVIKTLLAPLMPLLSPDIQQNAEQTSPCRNLLGSATEGKRAD